MHIYFAGAAGVAIGPLAMIALDLGHEVSGSDLQQTEMTAYLMERGAQIHIGQDGSQIAKAHAGLPIDWFIYSSALPDDHAELKFAREQGIKTSKRAEFINDLLKEKELRMVAVAGTHGKTTTTGMVIWLLKELGLPLSYSIGTSINYGPPAQYQQGSEFFIYECDEFDRNFLEFHPYLSLITAVDYDHPDTYKTKADYLDAFRSFAGQSEWVISWQTEGSVFGGEGKTNFSVLDSQDDQLSQITLPGHNRQNGWLAVQAVQEITQQPLDKLLEIINRFPGTNRRFEKLGDNLYTDYAHHPAEIASTIDLAQEVIQNSWQVRDHNNVVVAQTRPKPDAGVVCVYQPHQNIRQRLLLEEHGYKHCFDKAKAVYWVPTYLSREDGSEVIGVGELMADTSKSTTSKFSEMNDALWQKIEEHRQAGDLVVGMSAGDLDTWLRKQVKH